MNSLRSKNTPSQLRAATFGIPHRFQLKISSSIFFFKISVFQCDLLCYKIRKYLHLGGIIYVESTSARSFFLNAPAAGEA